MHRVTNHRRIVAGLSALAGLAATAPGAHAAPTVQASTGTVTVAPQNLSDAALSVVIRSSELTATRMRIRLNSAPAAVAGGCTVVTISPAIVDCPRRPNVVFRGTNNGDSVDFDLNAAAGINGTAFGKGGDDKLFGTDRADVLDGDSGNDEIKGFRGADDLRGEAGDDDLFGGSGNDKLQGGDNADLLNGGSGRDRLFARTEGANQHRDDEFFNNDTFRAEDGERDEIFCDSTPAFGLTPGTFDNLDENVNDVCRMA